MHENYSVDPLVAGNAPAHHLAAFMGYILRRDVLEKKAHESVD